MMTLAATLMTVMTVLCAQIRAERMQCKIVLCKTVLCKAQGPGG